MTIVATTPAPTPASSSARRPVPESAVVPAPSPTAHLTPADLDEIGRRLDAVRDSVLASRGADDAAYIRGMIDLQRKLELGGRALLLGSLLPPAWIAGTAMLSTAKILENMEIGHNVMHGQWDWMRDPEIHSTTWEWDNATPSDDWKHGHNFVHHTYTNVVGKDRDIGYSFFRLSADQPWRPWHLAQPLVNVLLLTFFEYGIAVYDVELEKVPTGEKSAKDAATHLLRVGRKVGKQVLKDYVAQPLLSGPSFLPALAGTFVANTARNVWTHTIIFCGHFPDGAEVFVEEQLEGETRGEWYVRQLLGSANIDGGPLLHVMSGNLSFQIEHHLFPDLPSNRYAEIAPTVRALCEEYGLPYTSGPLHVQTWQTWRKILRHALPGGEKVATTVATAPAVSAVAA